jgi:uncharacterized protein (DUF169 family)
MSTYEELSSKLKSALGLKGSPVGVKLLRTREEIPAGVPEIGEKVRHCEMVQKARNGDVFYATKDKHACAGGAGALGVMETPEKVLNGEFYFGLGDFGSKGAAKRTTGSITRVDEEHVATLYAPLEKAAFKPDVVVIIGNPKQMLRIAKANIYALGGRNYADFSGIQSVCADAVAEVYMTGEVNFTLGCMGSRKNAKIADEEMIVGIPAEKVQEIVDALERSAQK